MAALVLGGMVGGMVYGSACSLTAAAGDADASTGGTTGTRAVLYVDAEGGDCPVGFTDVGPGPYYESRAVVYLHTADFEGAIQECPAGFAKFIGPYYVSSITFACVGDGHPTTACVED
ncbi:MAG: hypothetical protein EXR71_16520 [Myxococcales bacterium]|nr:hypothetical protein [Myxococcales bacterium]